ncbi:hypothetical protein KC19_VG009100 [Ceratodon purpureus]|uniref:Uncharacterized protein n=1 Tax=Ceratodon purpureus TaxID=3225 RepID=A0A8T0HKR4_CERPU|nr:hypothetical protein KC19_VG009100 [Ceratodon purpureus]
MFGRRMFQLIPTKGACDGIHVIHGSSEQPRASQEMIPMKNGIATSIGIMVRMPERSLFAIDVDGWMRASTSLRWSWTPMNWQIEFEQMWRGMQLFEMDWWGGGGT